MRTERLGARDSACCAPTTGRWSIAPSAAVRSGAPVPKPSSGLSGSY